MDTKWVYDKDNYEWHGKEFREVKRLGKDNFMKSTYDTQHIDSGVYAKRQEMLNNP